MPVTVRDLMHRVHVVQLGRCACLCGRLEMSVAVEGLMHRVHVVQDGDGWSGASVSAGVCHVLGGMCGSGCALEGAGGIMSLTGCVARGARLERPCFSAHVICRVTVRDGRWPGLGSKTMSSNGMSRRAPCRGPGRRTRGFKPSVIDGLWTAEFAEERGWTRGLKL